MLRLIPVLAAILLSVNESCECFVPPFVCETRSLGRHVNLDLDAMQVWLDARNEDSEEETSVILDRGSPADVVLVELGFEFHGAEKILQVDGGSKLVDPSTSQVVGVITSDTDDHGQQAAIAAMGSVEWILVDKTADWTMIPAENLIAAAQSSGTKLAFSVDEASDVGGLARALELGVDALCVSSKAGIEVWEEAIASRIERAKNLVSGEQQIEDSIPQVVEGTCFRREVEGVILADRICVDLVQNLTPDQGCWIGSSAKLLALVLSEAAASEFVPTRPFRVNAGPVHSYILMADNTTKYLCELQAGDQVHIYNAKTGESRGIAVGRSKQEVRPCVLLELEVCDPESGRVQSNGQIFLQQAETVRLADHEKGFLRVTDLVAQKTGDNTAGVLLRTQVAGTHIGKQYTGSVVER